MILAKEALVISQQNSKVPQSVLDFIDQTIQQQALTGSYLAVLDFTVDGQFPLTDGQFEAVKQSALGNGYIVKSTGLTMKLTWS